MSLLAELKRRNVFRAAAAYAVVAWLLIEVSSVMLPTFDAPGWLLKVVTFFVLLGFPAVLIFAWAFEITPDGIKREHEVDRGKSIARQTGRQLDFIIIGVLAVALGYFVYDKFVPSSGPDVVLTEADRSIAVLPFVNISANKDDDYFSDGITEELLNLLARLPELRVSSRTSSFAFKGKDIDMPTVAQRLGVTKIIEGSVRRAGTRVRITAQLIDTETDSHLWSESYDRELEDIFAVQDDIAHSIVAALRVTLSPGDEHALESTHAANVEAYDLYLRGRAYFLRTTGEDTRRAIDMFSRAIEIDPTYAPAYAWLANSHTQFARFFERAPEHLSKANAASRKALELAPGLADAHIALGFVLTMQGQYEEAEQAFEAALRLSPRSTDAYFYYGMAAYHQGNNQRTAALWEQAVAMDPDDSRVLSLLPQVYRSLGRDQDAMEAYRKTALVLRRKLEMNPYDPQDLVALAHADLALGERERAIMSTHRVVGLDVVDAGVLYNAACVYSLAGETDKAIETLEKAHAKGLVDPAWMEQDSDLDALRDDARFKSLIARMKASLSATE